MIWAYSALLLQALLGVAGALNTWPIIGVFTQPSSDSHPDCAGNCLYLAASYVKYLESAGARVVPINYYSTTSQIDALFPKLNGFFFPGGGATFPASAQRVFDNVVKYSDAGDKVPLWGTCMGFQWLLISATRDTGVLDPKSGQMDAYNLSIPLDFTAAAPTSKMFGTINKDLYNILAKENVTMNNHHYGIWTDHFYNTPALTSFFNVLSTNVDRRGDEFVSTMEAFKYPIFGSQWHPEKNPYEWSETSEGIPAEAIDHSPDGVVIAQYMANFFVQQVRQNSHKYSSFAEEDGALIYNYKPSKTSSGGSFVQKYFFKNNF